MQAIKLGAFTSEKRADLSQLRKRVRQLKMEKALKTSAAFFANEIK